MLFLAVMLLCAQGLHTHESGADHEITHSGYDLPNSMHFGFFGGEEVRPNEVIQGDMAPVPDVDGAPDGAAIIPVVVSVGMLLWFRLARRPSRPPDLSGWGTPPPARAPPI